MQTLISNENKRLPLITGTSILLYVPPLNEGSGCGVSEGTGVCVVSDVLVSRVGTASDDVGRTDGDVGLRCNGTLVGTTRFDDVCKTCTLDRVLVTSGAVVVLGAGLWVVEGGEGGGVWVVEVGVGVGCTSREEVSGGVTVCVCVGGCVCGRVCVWEGVCVGGGGWG